MTTQNKIQQTAEETVVEEVVAEKLDELIEISKQPDFKSANYDPQHEKRNRFLSWVRPYKR